MFPKNHFLISALALQKLTTSGGFSFYLVVLLSLGTITGCTTPRAYVEQYEVEHLKIVFLDPQSLEKEWTLRTGEPGIRFLPRVSGRMTAFKTVKGFYDFTSDTLYCPKWDFEVCGHELHHAVLGHFHSQE